MMSACVLLTTVLTTLTAVSAFQRISSCNAMTISTYPFAASLTHKTWRRCFRTRLWVSIVSHRAVLTPAYCVYKEQTERWRIRVDSASTVSAGSLLMTDGFAIHPHYNPVTKENDIGLVHVFPHFIFTSSVNLGLLAGKDYVLPKNEAVMAIGWGAVNDKMVCAIGRDLTGKGQCLGDNGSPLLHDQLIIGIYSWNHQCVSSRYPGVNTFITKYIDWIKANY